MAVRGSVAGELARYLCLISLSSEVCRPADPPCLHRLSSSVFYFAPAFWISLFLLTHTNMHTHKKHKLTRTPPQFPSRTLSLFPSTSHPSNAPPPPLLPFPCSSPPPPNPSSRPEAAAGTCIASCYVGTMTTVMNSTWRSRIQADVGLCGCSASNGAHVSRG